MNCMSSTSPFFSNMGTKHSIPSITSTTSTIATTAATTTDAIKTAPTSSRPTAGMKNTFLTTSSFNSLEGFRDSVFASFDHTSSLTNGINGIKCINGINGINGISGTNGNSSTSNTSNIHANNIRSG